MTMDESLERRVRGSIPVYLEIGSKRTFAVAVEWPGWARIGRNEAAALESLAAYGQRYVASMGSAAQSLPLPTDASALTVVERLQGNATTDFGAPDVTPAADTRPIGKADGERLIALLRAAWAAFDAAAKDAAGFELRKGPRGGGRDVDRMVQHVLGADEAYVSLIGGRFRRDPAADAAEEAQRLQDAGIDAFWARVRGEPIPEGRRSKKLWAPAYYVRRSAWHALDHAWEIEDRVLR
jgi:hypothetical protein